MPVVLMNKEKNLPANEITLKGILAEETKKFIATMFQINAESVWLYPALTRADVWDEEEDERLFNFACDYFESKENEYQTPKSLIVQKDANVDVRFIPVSICKKTEATTTYEKIKKELEPLFLPEAAERISQRFIEKQFGENCNILVQPYISLVEEALETRKEFVDRLKEVAEFNHVPFMIK